MKDTHPVGVGKGPISWFGAINLQLWEGLANEEGDIEREWEIGVSYN